LKNGKRPNVKEKTLLKQNGFDPREYLTVKKNHEFVEFVKRGEKQTMTLRY